VLVTLADGLSAWNAYREAPPSTTSLALDRIQSGGRPPDLTPALRGQMARDFASWRVRSVVLGPCRTAGSWPGS
jgi:hypothetical protein